MRSSKGLLAGFSLTVLMGASPALAGKVLSVKADKLTVVIDEGTGAGVAKAAQVCFTDAADKEVGCGKVIGVTAKNATVKVDKDKIAGITKGMSTKLSDAAAPAEGDTTAAAPAEKKGKGGKKSTKYQRNLKLMYIPGLVPAGYSNLSFGYDKGSGTSDYKDTGSANFNLIGLGLEYEMPVGAKSLAFGLRYRIFPASTATADFNATNGLLYYETKQSAKAIGLFFDYYFMQSMLGKSTIFKLGSGLDIDQSTVSISIAAKTDDSAKAPLPAGAADATSATSKVGVVSLRIPASLMLFFDPIGLNFDVVPMIPLVEFGSSISSSGSSDGLDDFKKTNLKHKKSSIAADIRLGLFFAF